MTRKIEVVSYDPDWPTLCEGEASKIKYALGENCIAVHHVGSTAVPGLCAKPKIDVIAVVKRMPSVAQRLEEIGYTCKGEFNIPFHFLFSKRDRSTKINLHVFEEGNPEIELNLLFRDYLRNHPEILEEYAALKLNLVTEKALHEKKATMFSGYNLGKDAFIRRVLDQASFMGLCMRRCAHYEEWETVCNFRQKYFFDNVPMADPYTWTFDHKDHVHFVFYQGTKVVGYAHIQLWSDQRAALRIIVIDEHVRGQDLGSQFLSLCERWLRQYGYKVLQTQSSPHAYPFYLKHGYTEMSFNDPDGHESDPQDIDMGKTL